MRSSSPLVRAVAAVLACTTMMTSTSFAADISLGRPQVGKRFEIGVASKNEPRLLDSVDYSNVTNFLGAGIRNGGSTNQAGNTITALVADDITPDGQAGFDVLEVTFSVANFNTAPVTCRARIRFWFPDGTGGGPGTYYNVPANVGFTFDPFTFNPGVTLLTGTLGPGLFTMPGTTFWAGLTFDNNNGATGASAAQLDNMGQGLFDPADIGSSQDVGFATSAAGSFFGVSNPPGTLFNLGGSPPVSFGWEFISGAPTPATKSTWGRIKTMYK
jgi:hypothetical protein